MVPLSVGASGLIMTYVGGPIGLSLNLICLFLNGVGVSSSSYVLSPYVRRNLLVFTGRLRV